MKSIKILHLEDDELISLAALYAIEHNLSTEYNTKLIQVATLSALKKVLEEDNFDHYILDGKFPEGEIDAPKLNLSKAVDLIRKTKGSDVLIYVFSGERKHDLVDHLGDRLVAGIFQKPNIEELLALLKAKERSH